MAAPAVPSGEGKSNNKKNGNRLRQRNNKKPKEEADDDWDFPPAEEMVEQPETKKSAAEAELQMTWGEMWEQITQEFNSMFVNPDGFNKGATRRATRSTRLSQTENNEEDVADNGESSSNDSNSWASYGKEKALKLWNAKDPTGNPLLRSFAPLIILFFWNNAPLPDDARTYIARSLFAVNIVAQLVVFFFMIKPRIEKRMDDGDLEAKVEVKEQVWGAEAGAMQEVTDYVTSGEYDVSKVWAHLKQMAIQVPIAVGIHYKWEYTVPLVIQSSMAYFTVKNNQLYKMYMSDEEDPVTTKRPFTADTNNFWEFAQKWQQGGDANKKAVEKPLSSKSLAKQQKAKEMEMRKAR